MPPAAAAHWPRVLDVARQMVEEHGSLSRPALFQLLVAADLVPPHAEAGFRAAVAAAQQRGEFPQLVRVRTGPTPGSRWSDDRHEAERARQEEPSAYELWTTRSHECRALLRTLTGVLTVTLTPDTFAIFAAQGYRGHGPAGSGRARVRRAG